MSKKKRGVLAALLSAALLLSGCAEPSANPPEETAEVKPATGLEATAGTDATTPVVTEPAQTEATEPEPTDKPAPAEETAITAEYEHVKAELRGGALTVTILPGGDFPAAASGSAYPVTGLSGGYTDLFVGSMGNSVDSVFVFLLTESGTVECVPIGAPLAQWAGGGQEGDPAFVSLGELPKVSGVVSLHAGEVPLDEGGYNTVFAVTAEGEELDLTFPYYYALNPQEAPPTEDEAVRILTENGLADGMSFMPEGDAMYINGEYCAIIAAGKNSADSFVRELYFASGKSGAVYVYEVLGDCWLPSNRLAEIYSGSTDFQDLFAVISEPNGNELSELRTEGRVVEAALDDPQLSSDVPMVLVPLKNGLKVKVELIDFVPGGDIISEDVVEEYTLDRGDICAIYAHVMYDTSPLFVYAEWQDGPSVYSVYWWAVGGAEYGEDYMTYVAGFCEDAMG